MPEKYPVLNLPACKLLIEQERGLPMVFDQVRRRMVALTPEEWVRQHMLHYMMDALRYPLHLVSVEHTLSWNKMSRRCDIVVYKPGPQPVLIAEIKAPGVPLGQQVLNQAIRYNQAFMAPYLLLSNGMEHMTIMVRGGQQAETRFLDHIPTWEVLRQA